MQGEEFYEIIGDVPLVECPIPFCTVSRDTNLELQEHIHEDHQGHDD